MPFCSEDGQMLSSWMKGKILCHWHKHFYSLIYCLPKALNEVLLFPTLEWHYIYSRFFCWGFSFSLSSCVDTTRWKTKSQWFYSWNTEMQRSKPCQKEGGKTKMLHLFANLWCRRKFLKSSKSEKTSASGNKQDHLHCVNYKNIYFFSCWTKSFPEQHQVCYCVCWTSSQMRFCSGWALTQCNFCSQIFLIANKSSQDFVQVGRAGIFTVKNDKRCCIFTWLLSNICAVADTWFL